MHSDNHLGVHLLYFAYHKSMERYLLTLKYMIITITITITNDLFRHMNK